MIRPTTRDLLWFTALVAVAVAWWMDAQRRDERLADEKTMYQVMHDDNIKLEKENDALRRVVSELRSK
jgi:hypothetical protein